MIDTSFLSFGRYLKAKRIEKGITLEEVSRETRIRMDNLLLIEKEEHDKLPAEVFMRGFLRAYAKAIDADEEEAVRRYVSSLHVSRKIARSEADFVRLSTKSWAHLFMFLGMLVCIIAVSVFMMSAIHGRPRTDFKANQQQIEDVVVKTNHEAVIKSPPDVVHDSTCVESVVVSEKILLRVLAVEETWLKVIIDSRDSMEYSLQPGNSLKLEASYGFNLLIGNAAGVKLTLNDNPVEVPGKRGQVVNIELP
ncbi:MAG: helix-turn-helix domain-containing protein [Deltaproteobacteria bacterium]|nr:helix-turn-helix domain-containing protein [Deltaproteobacteria bacterium]MBW2662634.1 helix-turn-helix domain-containing protein [Deltaproteobacteria bacterium]